MNEAAERLRASGTFVCLRTGRPGTKLDKPPFRGRLGQWIFENISAETWKDWIGQGTKVINELRLDFSRERDQEVACLTAEQAVRVDLLRAEAETAVQRFAAVSGNLSEALLVLSRNETLVKVAQAWDAQKLVEGEALGDTLERLFHNTPLRPLIDKRVAR